MFQNTRIEPEPIGMGYATVSSTNHPPYTVEHDVVELERPLEITSQGVHHNFFLSLVKRLEPMNRFNL